MKGIRIKVVHRSWLHKGVVCKSRELYRSINGGPWHCIGVDL
ncbi:hypothetical protein AB0A69_08205 [Streptomyces sp. NPDC045431]